MKTFKRESLLNILDRLSGPVDSKSYFPCVKGILVKNFLGSFSLSTTNIDCFCEYKTTSNSITEFSGIVNFKEFKTFVKALPKKADVFIDVDKNTLVLTSGTLSKKLEMDKEDIWPTIPSFEVEFEVNLFFFKKSLVNSSYASSTDVTREFLNGLLLESVDGVIKAVSTDGHRLAETRHTSFKKDFKFFIPSLSLNGLVNIMLEDQDSPLRVSNNWCNWVSKDGFTYHGKVRSGKDVSFPDYKAVLESCNFANYSNSFELTKKELVAKLKEIKGSLCKERGFKTVILCGGDFYGMRFYNLNKDSFVELNGQYAEGGEYSVAVNYDYLMEAVDNCNYDYLTVKVNGPMDAVLIVDGDNNHVIMPARV